MAMIDFDFRWSIIRWFWAIHLSKEKHFWLHVAAQAGYFTGHMPILAINVV